MSNHRYDISKINIDLTVIRIEQIYSISMKIAVVGAGIIGMSTAFHLKQVIPSADVSVYAKDFSPNLTSDGAAGLWELYTPGVSSTGKISDWAKITYDYILEKIKTDPNSAKDGLMTVPGYQLYAADTFQLPDWHTIPFDSHRLKNEVVARRFPGFKSGWSFNTVFLEGSRYIPALTLKFLNIGGKIYRRELKCLGELYDECDILVNCTGLGSRSLVNDQEIFPVRGHVIRVKAPWIKEFCMCSDDVRNDGRTTYILPNQDCVVLGGTSQVDNWDLAPNEPDRKHILDTTSQLYPSLKKAEILGEWVGLRPSRPIVRLEKELLNVTTTSGKEKTMKVVHNYGHSGSGLTIHWGCAIDAANLVQQFIDDPKSKL